MLRVRRPLAALGGARLAVSRRGSARHDRQSAAVRPGRDTHLAAVSRAPHRDDPDRLLHHLLAALVADLPRRARLALVGTGERVMMPLAFALLAVSTIWTVVG